jgi:hypothetical protein
MSRATSDKVLCRTPTPGKSAKRIDRRKYELLRAAILESLSVEEPGVLFTDLFGLVAKRLTPRQRKEIGSIPWYTTTVKLEMEVAGDIARVPDSSPQRLIRRSKT